MSNAYSSYSEFGQKWAHRIPEHWKTKRLKAITTLSASASQTDGALTRLSSLSPVSTNIKVRNRPLRQLP